MKEIYQKMTKLKDMAESILYEVSDMLIEKECELRDLEELLDREEVDSDLHNELEELRIMEDYLDELIRNVESSCENNIYL